MDVEPGAALFGVHRKHGPSTPVQVERGEEGLRRLRDRLGAHANSLQTEQTLLDRPVGADARQPLGQARRTLVDEGLQGRREVHLVAGREARHVVVKPELGPVGHPRSLLAAPPLFLQFRPPLRRPVCISVLGNDRFGYSGLSRSARELDWLLP
jgi:hypothetical protein